MNILIIGSGGREHALAYCLEKSETCEKIFCVPGNPGISQIAECVDIDTTQTDKLIDFCKLQKINLVVIGPEQFLADGLSDQLRASGYAVFGPSKSAAQLETSKAFAKNFMQKYKIPTAKFAIFDKSQYKEAIDYLAHQDLPIVLKADGLAGGKGVVIATSQEEAMQVTKDYLDGALGSASEKIVIEEFMQGEEASVFAICDGENFITLAPAQDHKRIGEGNTGKNTGGMGAYAPANLVNSKVLEEVKSKIIEPTLRGIKEEKMPFIGCLYVGLMIKDDEAKVVEYNVRFGDPETQAVLSIFEGDFAKLLYSAAIGNLDKNAVKSISNKAACCVILASKGYPEKFEKGKTITGNLKEDEHTFVFHSGTKMYENNLVTSGGRVLGVTGINENLSLAIANAYKRVDEIEFEGKYFRKDIGKNQK